MRRRGHQRVVDAVPEAPKLAGQIALVAVIRAGSFNGKHLPVPNGLVVGFRKARIGSDESRFVPFDLKDVDPPLAFSGFLNRPPDLQRFLFPAIGDVYSQKSAVTEEKQIGPYSKVKPDIRRLDKEPVSFFSVSSSRAEREGKKCSLLGEVSLAPLVLGHITPPSLTSVHRITPVQVLSSLRSVAIRECEVSCFNPITCNAIGQGVGLC